MPCSSGTDRPYPSAGRLGHPSGALAGPGGYRLPSALASKGLKRPNVPILINSTQPLQEDHFPQTLHPFRQGYLKSYDSNSGVFQPARSTFSFPWRTMSRSASAVAYSKELGQQPPVGPIRELALVSAQGVMITSVGISR